MSNVLVIDDEGEMRGFVRTVLERDGHKVFEAEDGTIGLQIFYEQHFDVVITDLFMPEKGGIEVIQEITKALPRTTIIAMSGGSRFSPHLLEAARELGAVSVLNKPFRSADLLALMKSEDRGEHNEIRIFISWDALGRSISIGRVAYGGGFLRLEREHVEAWLDDPTGRWAAEAHAQVNGTIRYRLIRFHPSLSAEDRVQL